MTPPRLTEVWLAMNGQDISDRKDARRAVLVLLGPGRQIFPSSSPGAWLVRLSPAELDELIANGYFERTSEDGSLELSAEWPSGAG